ncbi:MAG: putative Ig domain-containing protein [bacterium]|nr:putative Ig domain-containing protein [bacterium]
MKKAILISIIGLSLASLGFAATALASQVSFRSTGGEPFVFTNNPGSYSPASGNAPTVGSRPWWGNLTGAYWISVNSNMGQDGNGPLFGSVVKFTKTVNITGVPTGGQVTWLVDNEAWLDVNGTRVLTGRADTSPACTNCKTTESVSIPASVLQTGSNQFDFYVKQNSSPNNAVPNRSPFGIVFTGSITTELNHTPVCPLISPRTVNVGQSLQFFYNATDSDNQVLTYAPSNLLVGMTWDNTLFSWTPTASQIGTFYPMIRATDPQGLYCERTATITVLATPPVSYDCSDNIDNDGDGLKDFGTGSNNDPGCSSATDNDEYNAPANRAPVCTVNSAFYVNGGQTLQFSVNTSDADGDIRTIASDNLLTLLALAQLEDGGANFAELPTQNSWNFSWTPSTSAETRTYEIDLKVTDGRGGIDYCSTAITVRPNNNPLPVYACSDNDDNDGDGDTDYPDDWDCYGPTDNNEYNSTNSGGGNGNSGGNTNTNTNINNITNNNSNTNNNNITITTNGGGSGGGSSNRAQCDDGRDNDDDGDYDYPDDSGCSSYSDNSEGTNSNTRYECNDGRDNDNDGDEDYPDDAGCRSRTDDSEDSEGNNNNRYQCNDNRDNDGDGDEDYPDDAGCSSRTDNSENSDSNNNNGNAPYFTSTPISTAVAGQIYSYNADAISPNNRTITYSLAVKPSGMTINSSTGLVQWFIPTNIGNTYQAALVVATDSNGNQTTQSYIISVRAQTLIPPVNPPINPPVQSLSISNLEINDVGGDVIVSFNTNISANGSVRYGQDSELDKTANFTYPFSQLSEFGQGTSHRVNLGPLASNQVYYLRAFASTPTRSGFSAEIAYVHTAGSVNGVQAVNTEVAGTDSCFDGIDNDRDGVADAADSDCEANLDGQVAGTFASTLESFGAFLISPWFLLLVIVVLVVYIVMTRRQHEVISTHGPIEIKS